MHAQEQKYSYLDEFQIIRALGSGYHAEVKLARDDDGNLYAIKKYKKETASLGTLQHELSIMEALKHENLVRLIDVRNNATYKRNNESMCQCFAIILEYVGGGQLFDFIAETGKFPQKVARTYFHQMMNGLHYMHSQGYAHRDIKPENILLTRDFRLKLADFGFSCLLDGKDGSGVLHTKLGTQGYMAPEVPIRHYDGTKVDIFAAGVILFIMYAGNPPFEKTHIYDPYFKLIKDKNYATFWKAHSRRRQVNYFSEAFRDLFQKMIAWSPEERPAVEEIATHLWVKGPVCSKDQIRDEFEHRFKKVEQGRESSRIEQQSQRNGMENRVSHQRSDSEVESRLLDIFQTEKGSQRQLIALEPLTPDDLVLEETAIHAISLLKNFLQNSRVVIEDSEDADEDPLVIMPVEVQDSDSQIFVKYEYSFELEGQKWSQFLQIAAKFGFSSSDRVVIAMEHISGNRLYFKKVAKQVKEIFSYCRAKDQTEH